LNQIDGNGLFEALNFKSDSELANVMKQEGVLYIFIDRRWIGDPLQQNANMSPEAVQGIMSSEYFSQLFKAPKTYLYGF